MIEYATDRTMEYTDAATQAGKPRLSLVTLPGFSYDIDESLSTIEGGIRTSQDLELNIRHSISSSTSYWEAFHNGSANNYIELVVSLKEHKGGSEITVPFPSKTKVTFGTGTDTDTIVLPGGSLHYYRDSGKGGDDGASPLALSLKRLNTTSQAMKVNLDAQMSFSFEDVLNWDPYEDGEKYSVQIDIVQTFYADAPSSGIVKDTMKKQVQLTPQNNLGFAVEIEDAMNGVYNQYNGEDAGAKEIPFNTKLDFSSYLASDIDVKEYATKDYYLEYKIYQKVENDVGVETYEPYTGDNLKVVNPASINPLPFPWKYNLTEDLIRNGSLSTLGTPQEPGLVMIPLELHIDDVNAIDLTNYKVEGNLRIVDKGAEIGDVERSLILVDFYIILSAKIKTDSIFSE